MTLSVTYSYASILTLRNLLL